MSCTETGPVGDDRGLAPVVDPDRLRRAWETVRGDLLAERLPAGHWEGRLASSALSTATAVSALAIVRRQATHDRRLAWLDTGHVEGLILSGLNWLADVQLDDGGWGDTDRSHSNIATTYLAAAAFRLTGVPARRSDLLLRADAYIHAAGGVAALRRRYGRDKTFAVPILTHCALASMVPWRRVAPLPFELACLPQSMLRFARLPVVSYALPALIAIGLARYTHRPPLNPLLRVIRRAAVEPSLRVLERIQPASGGFLEATPLTSFVVMSLAGSGRAAHPVVQRGVEFLIASAREDGSWPIDTNLATWVTSLSIGALATGGDGEPAREALDWLLSCQHNEVHPFTGAAPGGWGWTDLSGAVPDADDTPAALLALGHARRGAAPGDRLRIDRAAAAGIEWLLGLQNRDGGWPTFCRGWGKLPFDRSGADLTAHALRALALWRDGGTHHRAARGLHLAEPEAGDRETCRGGVDEPSTHEVDDIDTQHAADGRAGGDPDSTSLPASAAPRSVAPHRLDAAIARGLAYLARRQRGDGSWLPLWFGNQFEPDESNPVYGTARVLLAYRDLGQLATAPARRGFAWLVADQNADGGWGCAAWAAGRAREERTSSVEETAVALEAILADTQSPSSREAARRGAQWLATAVEEGRHRSAAPIGFYFARLWYYESLYPLIFAASALGRAASLTDDPALRDRAAAHAQRP